MRIPVGKTDTKLLIKEHSTRKSKRNSSHKICGECFVKIELGIAENLLKINPTTISNEFYKKFG